MTKIYNNIWNLFSILIKYFNFSKKIYESEFCDVEKNIDVLLKNWAKNMTAKKIFQSSPKLNDSLVDTTLAHSLNWLDLTSLVFENI